MKRKVGMLLLMTVLSLTACGGETVQESAGSVESGAAAVESSEAAGSTEAAESSEVAGSAEVAESSEAAESTEAAQADSKDYAPGVFTETGYESEYMGYRFVTPEGCVLASAEELAQIAGLSVDLLAENYDGFSDAMIEQAKNTIVYDFYAQFENSSANMSISLEPNNANIESVEVLADIFALQMQGFTDMEVTVRDERETVTIAGNEYLKITTDTNYQGFSMIQECYMAIRNDKLVYMTLTYIPGEEAQAQAIINGFSEY